jgi:hypothetical protein
VDFIVLLRIESLFQLEGEYINESEILLLALGKEPVECCCSLEGEEKLRWRAA